MVVMEASSQATQPVPMLDRIVIMPLNGICGTREYLGKDDVFRPDEPSRK
jgi:hypothetical protein